MERPPAAANRRLGRLWLAAVVALMLAQSCGGDVAATDGERSAEPATVRNLATIATLQDQFNRDTGSARLILLISPT